MFIKQLIIITLLSLLTTINLCAQNEVEILPEGIVPPRTVVGNISSPANGQMIYDTDSIALCYYNGSDWIKLNGRGSKKKTIHFRPFDFITFAPSLDSEFGSNLWPFGEIGTISITKPHDWDGQSDVEIEVYFVPKLSGSPPQEVIFELRAKSFDFGDALDVQEAIPTTLPIMISQTIDVSTLEDKLLKENFIWHYNTVGGSLDKELWIFSLKNTGTTNVSGSFMGGSLSYMTK